ncbi:MAG: AAA domain-containing protein [Chitinophagales bacterium]
MSDSKFLQILKQKLTVGNRRSIHLNVLPSRQLNRLDLKDIEVLQANLPQKFIETLLTKSKFTFHLEYRNAEKRIEQLEEDESKTLLLLNKRLNAITYENNDNFLEHGVKPFAFGYPILLKRDRSDPKRIIKAPVLIWYLDIEKSATQAYKWTIRREEDYPILVNQMLIAHIEKDENITLQNIAEEFLDDSKIDESELVDIANQILKQFNAEEEHFSAIVTPCPGSDTIKHIDLKKPTIRWAGVFGIFKTQKQPIIKDIDQLMRLQSPELVERENPDLHTEIRNLENSLEQSDILYDKYKTAEISFQKSTFVGIATDPSQQAIINTLAKSPLKIIQGPPGTGKSQSLTALILNALENGAKCLVVCEKRTALEVIQNNLHRLGLQDLTIIIEDISKDRTKVVDSVRDRIDRKAEMPTFEEFQYQHVLAQARKAKEIVNGHHHFLGRERLGAYNWTDLVGLFLKRVEQENKIAALDELLNTASFEFAYNEYLSLLEAIQQSQPLFANIPLENQKNNLFSINIWTALQSHPLQRISKRLYQSEKPAEARFYVEKQLKRFVPEIERLLAELQKIRREYIQKLQNQYETIFHSLKGKTDALQNRLQQNLQLYKDNFDQTSGMTHFGVKVLAVFSGKHQQILQEQKQCIGDYFEIKSKWNETKYFDHTFTEVGEEEVFTFSQLKENVAIFVASLETWKSEFPKWIENYADDLSGQNIQPPIEMDESLAMVQSHYQEHIEAINEADFLQAQIVEGDERLKSQMINLQWLVNHLSEIQQNFNAYVSFAKWQYFYLNCHALQQSVLKALIQIQPSDWQIAFEGWYFHWTLARNESTETPKDDQTLKSLRAYMKSIEELQIPKILRAWHRYQHKSVRKFNDRATHTSVKRLYNKRGSKGERRNSLRKIINADFDLFTDFFPVTLVNPVVCSSIIPLKQNLFDLVIFDEASQLRLEDTFAALMRGRHKVVSGDTHQMPPTSYFASSKTMLIDWTEADEETTDFEMIDSDDTDLAEKESLLEYAEDMGYQRSFLDFHYRSRHPDLIAFSNAAFYGSRLVPMPAMKDYQAIELIEVDGLYDRNINKDEAERVLQLLLEIVDGGRQTVDDKRETETEEIIKVPSVGVATFNLHQRNYLLECLQELKLADEVAARKINALEAAGLFVKNLENVQGDERDVIIISTTFGRREDGRFLQLFGPINQAKGYKLLNVIVTRAKQKVYVVTSIPSEFYNQYAVQIAEIGNTGRTSLYAYISYAKALTIGNQELKQSILETLAAHCPEPIYNHYSHQAASPFIEEVARRLANFIATERIQTHYCCGGFVIDIAVLPAENELNQTIWAIECDGSKAHKSSEAYMHDLYREIQLERLGFQVLRIYSANWWMDAEGSLRKVVDSCV